MCDNNFSKTTSDNCVFMKRYSSRNFIILLLYVDDRSVVGNDVIEIEALKKKLGNEFTMKDLSSAKQILGIEITRDRKRCKLWLHKEGIWRRCLSGLI